MTELKCNYCGAKFNRGTDRIHDKQRNLYYHIPCIKRMFLNGRNSCYGHIDIAKKIFAEIEDNVMCDFSEFDMIAYGYLKEKWLKGDDVK